MGNSIKINYEAVETDASQIEEVASFFQESSLNPDDCFTTLAANENVHLIFVEAQNLYVSLGEAIDREAVNIRSIGNEFEEYDAMIADFVSQLGD